MSTAFDLDHFLAQPLTARVATSGPTIRPAWYLWEDQAFWFLSGPWAKTGRLKPAALTAKDLSYHIGQASFSGARRG